MLSSMRFRRAVVLRCAATAAAAIVTPTHLRAAVSFGQIDDFQDGTTMGWQHGLTSSMPPTNVPNGGPGGTGDAYLQNVSIGGLGPNSRQVMFNLDQWTGNFVTAGVNRLSGMMINLGPTDLFMRLAIRGGDFSTQYGSTSAIMLPAGSLTWQPVTFGLTSSTLGPIVGSETLEAVLSNVLELRILSAQAGPDFRGDILTSTLGVDNLRALRTPGDANFDGIVNLSDFNILASNFGTSGGATWQQADFNFDGVVNLNDFNLLAANFGTSASVGGPTPQDWSALAAAAGAVPEPAVAAPGVFAMLALRCRRRRDRRG